MWLWAIIILVVFGMVLLAVRSKLSTPISKPIEPHKEDPIEDRTLPGGLRWASSDEVRPSTRDAYEKGEMSNDQMAEMLRACGWNAQLDKDGKLIIPKVNEDNDD